jgi:hypothetical protein
VDRCLVGVACQNLLFRVSQLSTAAPSGVVGALVMWCDVRDCNQMLELAVLLQQRFQYAVPGGVPGLAASFGSRPCLFTARRFPLSASSSDLRTTRLYCRPYAPGAVAVHCRPSSARLPDTLAAGVWAWLMRLGIVQLM